MFTCVVDAKGEETEEVGSRHVPNRGSSNCVYMCCGCKRTEEVGQVSTLVQVTGITLSSGQVSTLVQVTGIRYRN